MIILYIDDDLDDIEIFKDAINQIDPTIELVTYHDCEEAIEKLKSLSELPQFIFLDLNMPRLSGRDCLVILKSNERLKTIPVIVCTTACSNVDAWSILPSEQPISSLSLITSK